MNDDDDNSNDNVTKMRSHSQRSEKRKHNSTIKFIERTNKKWERKREREMEDKKCIQFIIVFDCIALVIPDFVLCSFISWILLSPSLFTNCLSTTLSLWFFCQFFFVCTDFGSGCRLLGFFLVDTVKFLSGLIFKMFDICTFSFECSGKKKTERKNCAIQTWRQNWVWMNSQKGRSR